MKFFILLLLLCVNTLNVQASVILSKNTVTELSDFYLLHSDSYASDRGLSLVEVLPSKSDGLFGQRNIKGEVNAGSFGAVISNDPFYLFADTLGVLPNLLSPFNKGLSDASVFVLVSNIINEKYVRSIISDAFLFSVNEIVDDDENARRVPLPAAFWLFASAIGGLFGFRRARAT